MAGRIIVVGLGPGDKSQLTIGIYDLIKNAERLYVRTEEHPVLKELQTEGLKFRSFDEIYTKHDDFSSVYEVIAENLFREANKGELVYAVPGHPMVAEKTVQLLLDDAAELGVTVDVKGGQSFLDPLFSALKIDPIEGLSFCDALDLDPDQLPLNNHLVICQVYDAFIASEVKLVLLEWLPPEYEVYIVRSAGNADEVIFRVPLYELDHQMELDNLTSVYVPPVKAENLLNSSFPRLRKVIQTLRGSNGCPWDRKQTHESLRKYLIEEAYEVLEAIDEKDEDHLAEELGDILLQVLLHAQIGEDEGYFNIYDVIRSLTDKMIRRHPHVFGEEEADTPEQVTTNWEKIKEKEKEGQLSESLFSSVGKGLPSLLRAVEMQKTAAKVGFDWPDMASVWDKINEEIEECREEEQNGNADGLENELGDVLFSVVNLARKHRIDPIVALESTNRKFMSRFAEVEGKAREMGKPLTALTLQEMDEIWEKAKKN